MTRAGIYTRVSLDRDGTSESPDRQEADCRALAAKNGWQVVEVYSDRNISAFKRGVRRPEYERLLADLRFGLLDVIIVWKLDRLTRAGAGILGLLDEHKDARLVTVMDNIDTATSGGRLVISVLAEQARAESTNTSDRVTRAHQAAAANGRMHSGGSRQYGYTRDAVIVPEEAVVVSEVYKRIMSGESLRRIAYDLNERGVDTTKGNQWTSQSLGQMMRSPRLAGLRTYNGEVMRGAWKPILRLRLHEDLLAALDKTPAVRRTVRRHLLTGLVTCQLCGGKLKTLGFRMKNGKPFERYQCVGQPGMINCGKVAIAKNSTDAYVTERLIDFLATAGLRPLDDLGDDGELHQLLADDRKALAELVRERFVNRTIGDDAFVPARVALEERIATTEQALVVIEQRRERSAIGSLPLGDRDALEVWWDKASMEERRHLLAKTLHRVVIHPAKRRGGNVFDTNRVEFDWRWDVWMDSAARFEDHATPEQLSALTAHLEANLDTIEQAAVHAQDDESRRPSPVTRSGRRRRSQMS
jgi:DNA invertase Pin-like site-specific DNA recombinase